MRTVTARLGRLVLGHLSAYAEVAGEDARDAAALLARRLLKLFVAAVCSLVALLMLCACLLALAWDGPWRVWTAAGLALAFAAVAAALAYPVLRRHEHPDALFFTRIRSELNRDRELIERAFNGEDRARPGTAEASERPNA